MSSYFRIFVFAYMAENDNCFDLCCILHELSNPICCCVSWALWRVFLCFCVFIIIDRYFYCVYNFV